MNNTEFAENLANYLVGATTAEYRILKKDILAFLKYFDCAIYSPKNQLLGFSVEDVIYRYGSKETHSKLTIEQAQWVLHRADYLNSKHEYGFDWEDIDNAIVDWEKEGCPSYE